MIPECDTLGFSINAIDELELTILELIGKGTTVNELFNELKSYFDEEDLKDSWAEFEKLIFTKINNGLLTKSIQVII
jgi:DNA gyrase inhibitor GyrI